MLKGEEKFLWSFLLKRYDVLIVHNKMNLLSRQWWELFRFLLVPESYATCNSLLDRTRWSRSDGPGPPSKHKNITISRHENNSTITWFLSAEQKGSEEEKFANVGLPFFGIRRVRFVYACARLTLHAVRPKSCYVEGGHQVPSTARPW